MSHYKSLVSYLKKHCAPSNMCFLGPHVYSCLQPNMRGAEKDDVCGNVAAGRFVSGREHEEASVSQ